MHSAHKGVTNVKITSGIQQKTEVMAANVNQCTEDLWTFETPVYISEKLKQAIKTHNGFSAPPIGPIGESIISDQLP